MDPAWRGNRADPAGWPHLNKGVGQESHGFCTGRQEKGVGPPPRRLVETSDGGGAGGAEDGGVVAPELPADAAAALEVTE
jgi:hypothetical protein